MYADSITIYAKTCEGVRAGIKYDFMKSRKYLYLALTAVAFSAMFAACSSKGNTPEDKTTKKCWEVTTKYLNEGTTEVAYYWETSTEVLERVKVLNM